DGGAFSRSTRCKPAPSCRQTRPNRCLGLGFYPRTRSTRWRVGALLRPALGTLRLRRPSVKRGLLVTSNGRSSPHGVRHRPRIVASHRRRRSGAPTPRGGHLPPDRARSAPFG